MPHRDAFGGGLPLPILTTKRGHRLTLEKGGDPLHVIPARVVPKNGST